MKLVTLTSLTARRLGDFKSINMIKKAGFDGFDYTLDDGTENLKAELVGDDYLDYVRRLKAEADRIGLPCLQAHAPSPKTTDEKCADSQIPMFIRSIDVAAELGCKILVIHPGNELTAMQNKTYLYDKLLPHAKERGITIATENMFSWKDETETETVPSACGTCKSFVEHVDVVADENFTACLDLGHASMVNCEGAPALIRALGKRIGALHVHDNDCYHDDHTFPFVGKMDWKEICKALKEVGYGGHFTFEADAFMVGYPDELLQDCLNLLEKTGRYLIKMIENS